MKHALHAVLILANLTVLASMLAIAAPASAPAAPAVHRVAGSHDASSRKPLTPAQVHALVLEALANQHHDDESLDLFERIERRVEHSGSADGRILEEKTFRVVPTGSGNIKILLKNGGHSVSRGDYLHALQNWESILEVAVHPDDPEQQQLLAKQQKKFKDRARFIDAVPEAYDITWLGREVVAGRLLEKLLFEPKSDYIPRGNSTDWLVHAKATVWIDAGDAQVARIEAEVIRDIPVGAGILGKVYHGSRILIEQAPVAPGIWEVTHYQYDISGRKFLFPFELHEVTTARHYRFIGSPAAALAVVRKNLSDGPVVPADP